MVAQFDQFAEDYAEILQQNLRLITKDILYFTRYRAKLAAKAVGSERTNLRILDYGCGTGTSIPFLKIEFPNCAIVACDVSERSTDIVHRTHPDVEITSTTNIEGGPFDVIFIGGLIHHVPSNERLGVLNNLRELLNPGGIACFFEHNPVNPVTRQLVANCIYDEGAELISAKNLISLLEKSARFTVQRRGYSVFLPPALGRLAFIENALRWCPFGAQYFVFAVPA